MEPQNHVLDVLHWHANKQNYSINMCAIKRAFKARKNLFWFWFSTFYSNKRDMQLNGMRLSGLDAIFPLPVPGKWTSNVRGLSLWVTFELSSMIISLTVSISL